MFAHVKQEVDAIAASSTLSPEQIAARRSELVAQLHRLRAQVVAFADAEAAALRLLEARLQHLSNTDRPPLDLPVAIADHLYRTGQQAAGDAVHSEVLSSAQRQLVDRGEWAAINAAAAAIRQRDVTHALQWAHTNSSRLRRLSSTLEFSLRLHEFLELVRLGQRGEAMALAAEHLAPAAQAAAAAPEASGGEGGTSASGNSGVMAQLQAAMGVLAWPHPASCGVAEIEALFHIDAWRELEVQFRAQAAAVLGLPPRTVLVQAVAAGVTALHSYGCKLQHLREPAPATATAAAAAAQWGGPQGGAALRIVCVPSGTEAAAMAAAAAWDDSGGDDGITAGGGGACGCPVCVPHYFAAAAERLPRVARTVTQLVCPITREPLNERNPATVLPNGRVYGSATVSLLTGSAAGVGAGVGVGAAQAEGDGPRVLDPATGQTFAAAATRRAYFM